MGTTLQCKCLFRPHCGGGPSLTATKQPAAIIPDILLVPESTDRPSSSLLAHHQSQVTTGDCLSTPPPPVDVAEGSAKADLVSCSNDLSVVDTHAQSEAVHLNLDSQVDAVHVDQDTLSASKHGDDQVVPVLLDRYPQNRSYSTFSKQSPTVHSQFHTNAQAAPVQTHSEAIPPTNHSHDLNQLNEESHEEVDIIKDKTASPPEHHYSANIIVKKLDEDDDIENEKVIGQNEATGICEIS